MANRVYRQPAAERKRAWGEIGKRREVRVWVGDGDSQAVSRLSRDCSRCSVTHWCQIHAALPKPASWKWPWGVGHGGHSTVDIWGWICREVVLQGPGVCPDCMGSAAFLLATAARWPQRLLGSSRAAWGWQWIPLSSRVLQYTWVPLFWWFPMLTWVSWWKCLRREGPGSYRSPA